MFLFWGDSLRVILHSDLNAFYASVECLHQLDIRHKPVAVCGHQELRHGIVLAKNQLAKQYGVKTGDAIWQARQKAPGLIVVPPNFPLYQKFSQLVRSIYLQYTPNVESFGLDEAWLDLTQPDMTLEQGCIIAEELRRRVKEEVGLTVSIGISWNKIFAKLGSDYQKPDAVTLITPENYRSLVWPLPASDLLYVGPATSKKLARYGITTIGGIANTRPALLHAWLKKWGLYLHTFANGRDKSPVQPADTIAPIQSIGNSLTTPHDLDSNEDVKLTLYMLSESVAARLRSHGFRCQTVQISIRDTGLGWFSRQQRLSCSTNLSGEIADAAMALFCRHHDWQSPVRSLGVRGCDLVPDTEPEQISVFLDEQQRLKKQALERTMDDLHARFGDAVIKRGVLLTDPAIGLANPKDDHTIHPVGYFAYGIS